MFMPVDERCQHVERDCVDEVPGERVDPHRLLFAEQKGDSIVALSCDATVGMVLRSW